MKNIGNINGVGIYSDPNVPEDKIVATPTYSNELDAILANINTETNRFGGTLYHTDPLVFSRKADVARKAILKLIEQASDV